MDCDLETYKTMNHERRRTEARLLKGLRATFVKQIEDDEIGLGRALRFALHAEQSAATVMLGSAIRLEVGFTKRNIEIRKRQVLSLNLAIKYASEVGSGVINEDPSSPFSELVSDYMDWL
jgi:hypothetical protein